MQTNFTAEQLADPHVATSEAILRKCVHCGFCTATCPTYVTLGNELDSPRGRIYQIKDMLENGRPAVLQHVLDQIDAAARTVELVAERHIGRTGGRAEAAMHAFAQDRLGCGNMRIGELLGGEIGLHVDTP